GGLAWVGKAATLLTFVGGAMIVVAIWNGGDLPGGYWRSFGVVMVLLAAAAIATPVVHRMGEPATPTAVTNCPFDGTKVDGAVGKRITCPKCGRTFEVRLG
ncbi:MAG TPA: hypothetical protein VFY15_00035, partial [Acidimicrobiia bacterium]|nr:hypothetical protein [Acidimicrobiia bacterium]